MDLEAIKKLLTTAVGEAEATKVVESLSAFVEKTKKEATDGVAAKVTEAVKEERVRLETIKLQELETAKADADKRIAEEVAQYETVLAKRVKVLLETAVTKHGDAITAVVKENQVAKGSKLLQEVNALVAEAKAEIEASEKADPKVVADLTAQVTKLTEELAAKDKAILEQKARANVAEQTAKELRESIDAKVTVAVVESQEATKGQAAVDLHPDSGNTVVEGAATGAAAAKPKFSPEMERMRKMAGIKAGAGK